MPNKNSKMKDKIKHNYTYEDVTNIRRSLVTKPMILLLKKEQTVLIIHKQLLKGESQSNLLQRPPLYNGHIFCPRGQIIHTLTLSTTATLFNPQGGLCGEVQLYIRVTSLIIKSQRFTLCEFNEMQCIDASRTILTHP